MEEVRVKEILQVLEVCVCLNVHHKVLQKDLRQDRHPEHLILLPLCQLLNLLIVFRLAEFHCFSKSI